MSIEQRSSNSSESCTASLPSVGSRRARSRIRQWAHQRVSRVGLGCSLCGHGSPGAARSRCCARAVLLRGGAAGCLLLQRGVVLSRAGAGRAATFVLRYRSSSASSVTTKELGRFPLPGGAGVPTAALPSGALLSARLARQARLLRFVFFLGATAVSPARCASPSSAAVTAASVLSSCPALSASSSLVEVYRRGL